MTEGTIFTFSILGSFSHTTYDTLLYPHNLVTQSPKMVEWKERYEPINGYILHKENKKYLLRQYDKEIIDETEELDNVNKLPIRVKKYIEYAAKNNDILCLITDYKSFKIVPELVFNFYEQVHLDNITHSNEIAWTLWKIVAHCAKHGRVNLRVASVKSWGKTSYFQVLDHLLSKCYVITSPKTVPGICLGITNDGVVVLDEISGDLEAQARRAIGDILFQIGDLRNKLKLGSAGSFAHRTKPVYDITNLSCVVLFNPIEYYSEKNKYFDSMFTNSPAINDRYFPLRLSDGYLPIEQFNSSKFKKIDDNIKGIFTNFMKSAEWVKLNWKNEVDKQYIYDSVNKISITGRHKDSFIELCSFIYLYVKHKKMILSSLDFDEEYNVLMNELVKWNKDYLKMMENAKDTSDLSSYEVE